MKRAMKAITRWYYRLLDWSQRTWVRFRATEVGKGVVWLAPRLRHWTWIALKLEAAFFVAFMLLSYAMMVFMVMVFTGNGKAAIGSFTKITVVAMGLFAASRFVKKKPEVADAIKVAVKPR